ncbi:MAG: M20/M25/M40 family metallo-hydrolase [Pseudomonadota bacterium]
MMRWFFVLLSSVFLAACGSKPIASASVAERELIGAAMMRDIEILASDDFGGRKPGTLGEEKTVAFITQRMSETGLVSGTNDPGSEWRAPVSLVSTKPFTSVVGLRVGRRSFVFEEEASVAFTSRRRALVERGETVFVGRLGGDIPDDQVAGKVVIMLGEAGESPRRREKLFAKGPAAIITVVQNEAEIAGIRTAFGNERILLSSEETLTLNAYATEAAIIRALGKRTWSEFTKAADETGFEPLAVNALATVEATSDRREFTSYNVIGKIEGIVPDSGAVLMLAHWDHLGECGPASAADRICNGAVDNASGLAAMLEVSRRLAVSGSHDRDIYVVATSAEEAGLLGAKAFAQTPPLPLSSFVAAFNFDTSAVAPSGSSVGFIGDGRTAIDGEIKSILGRANRKLGDAAFANEFVQRQDGWVLLNEGVPTVLLSTAFASRSVLGPYLDRAYHSPRDEVAGIELGGAIDDVLLHEELVRRFADTKTYQPSPVAGEPLAP